jgi:hypothetical protein
MDSDAGQERYPTLADFAREVGAHPNTVRKLLREGEVPYTVEDLASGAHVRPEALRPNKFRYLVPASAIQHVAATIHEPVRSSRKVTGAGDSGPNTVTSQGPGESAIKLRADVARLEAENALLREHNTFLQDLTERLLPMLPAGPNTTSQAGEVPKASWWRRLFRGS